MPKYLSTILIRESISELSKHHVFFGTSFLVLKRAEAPVGKTMRISLDEANRELLQQHYRIHPKSAHFFMPFRKKKGEVNWVKPKYASTTLQAVNTQSFRDAVLHRPNQNLWGWSTDYVRQLERHLIQRRKIPLFHLAVWIYQGTAWSDDDARQSVSRRFVQEFRLNAEEIGALFEDRIASSLVEESSFQPTPAKWQQVLEGFPPPEDVPPEQSGTLQFLEFSGLGPVKTLRLDPGQRLNLVTGDNGLGKTFLLDVAWWALTQEWVEKPIISLDRSVSDVWVKFLVATSPEARPVLAKFYLLKVRHPGIQFLAQTPNPTNAQWNQHRYWKEIHQNLYTWHKGVCVYCASWTPQLRSRGVDHTSIDHFVPKSRNRLLAYEWSNFRMVRSKLNNRKDNFEDVLDPCTLQLGWFRLDFTTFLLEPDSTLPAQTKSQVTATIQRLLLNSDPAYVNERARVIYRYAAGKIAFADIQKLYPFIAYEMQAGNFDVLHKPSVVSALARRPWLAT